MAKPNRELITSIRETAERLRDEKVRYDWSETEICNCGHLVQTVGKISEGNLLNLLDVAGWGLWTNIVTNEKHPSLDIVCPVAKRSMNSVVSDLYTIGFSKRDIIQLEHCSNKEVQKRSGRLLAHNKREDVITYLETWADILEEQRVKEAEMILPKEGEEIPIKQSVKVLTTN